MSDLKNNRKKALSERDWDTAIKYGEMELKQDPQSVKVLNDLAYASYFNKKDYDQALACCDKIHEVIPTENLKVLSDKYSMRYMRHNEVLGEIYYIQGRDKEALEIFDRLKVLGSYFSKKYSLTAMILIRQKNYEGAAKEYTDMLTNCPRHFKEATNGLLDLVDIDHLNEGTYAGLRHQARGLFNKISASDSNFKDIKGRIKTINQPTGSGREIPEAVMVVDICESSRMMDLYGDSATYVIKNALEGIMYPIFEDKKSSFAKGTGDGFLVCFPNSKSALDAAIQVLESVNTYNSNVADGPEIHLRVGIHFGEVRVRPDGDRHGTNINIPFRIEGLKEDDLVVVKDGISQEEFPSIDRIFITEALHNDVLKKGNYNIRYLGLFEHRNITGMHKIYQAMTGNEK